MLIENRPRLRLAVRGALSFCGLIAIGAGHAQENAPAAIDSDKVLCIPGIRGSSNVNGFVGCSDLVAYTQEIPPSRSGAGGEPSCVRVVVVKQIDTASPPLILSALTERHLPEVTVNFRSKGEPPRVFLRVQMTNVRIEKIKNSESSDGDGFPIDKERIVLLPSKFTFTFTPSRADGSPDAAITVGFDCNTAEAL